MRVVYWNTCYITPVLVPFNNLLHLLLMYCWWVCCRSYNVRKQTTSEVHVSLFELFFCGSSSLNSNFPAAASYNNIMM